MRSELQYSPAYWPQSNQCERTNRQIGEILRCMTNTKTAEKQDWYKYIKYVEFAMRSSPISGTHITPFEACEFLQCTVLGKHGAVSDDVTLRGRDVIFFLKQAKIISRCRYVPGMPRPGVSK